MKSKIVFFSFAFIAIANSSPVTTFNEDEASTEVTTNDLYIVISQKWYDKHGCPTSELDAEECNSCFGCLRTEKGEECKMVRCEDHFYTDNYKPGEHCEAELEFFSNCKYCTCNNNGTDAECDDSSCRYYT